MAKLTIEIEIDDTQESWDALYRRIEKSVELDAKPQSTISSKTPMTYDLLLDPERAIGEAADFFGVSIGHE